MCVGVNEKDEKKEEDEEDEAMPELNGRTRRLRDEEIIASQGGRFCRYFWSRFPSIASPHPLRSHVPDFRTYDAFIMP